MHSPSSIQPICTQRRRQTNEFASYSKQNACLDLAEAEDDNLLATVLGGKRPKRLRLQQVESRHLRLCWTSFHDLVALEHRGRMHFQPLGLQWPEAAVGQGPKAEFNGERRADAYRVPKR